MSFETIMRDCAAHEDQRQRETSALEREERRLAAETLALARSGDFSRLYEAMEYRNNIELVFRALFAAASPSSKAAIEALVQTHVANYAETDQ